MWVSAPHARRSHHPKPRHGDEALAAVTTMSFSATDDVSMNAPFAVEVHSNVRGSNRLRR